MSSSIVRNDTVSLLTEEQHLGSHSSELSGQPWLKDYRLAFSPILVINRGAIFGRDCCHKMFSFRGIVKC
jgi:hypothetical protein